MKRFVYGILVACIMMGSATAKTYTDKTFLMPRSHGMNMAMEYTTWHKQTSMIDDNKFGGSIQVTGFYEESENKKDLGKYFGVTNYGNDCSLDDFFTVRPDSFEYVNREHAEAAFLFHTSQQAADANGMPNGLGDKTLADKITWRPYRHAYGVRLDYHQKLDKLLKGLYFKVSLPIVHVKTSMGWTSSCCGCDPCSTGTADYCTKQALTDDNGDLTGAEKSLADYLTGNVESTAALDIQDKLCKAKIHNNNTKTGIADLDFVLGYNFLYKPTRHVNANIAVTVPLGNEPNGEYLFPAIVGNAGHWAVGAGFDSSFQVWKEDKKSLDFLFACNYRYLFESVEKRTMGFLWPLTGGNIGGLSSASGRRAMYGHWFLGAKKGVAKVTPLANFLTRDLRVTPGSHFEAITQMSFNWCKFTLDCGYNLFMRRADDVRLIKEPCCNTGCATTCNTGCATDCTTDCGGWLNDTYYIPEVNYETSAAFDSADGLWSVPDPINEEHLCLDACTQPSVVSHKLYAGAGYSFDKWDYPVMLGLGGSYEWETDNDCLRTWALWAKLGVTF